MIELVDIGSLRRLYGVWTARLEQIYGHPARADFAAAIAAMLGVLIFDALPGLVIGIAVSMLLLIYRSSRPHVARLAKQGGVWLVELKSMLSRRGIDFRIVRDIGQVRDTLRQTGDAPMLEIDPTIDDALAAYEGRAADSAE